MPFLDVKEAIVIEKLALQKDLDKLFMQLEGEIAVDDPVGLTFNVGIIRGMFYVMGVEPNSESRYESLTRLIKAKYDELDSVPIPEDQ
jgi:hypothetical protein